MASGRISVAPGEIARQHIRYGNGILLRGGALQAVGEHQPVEQEGQHGPGDDPQGADAAVGQEKIRGAATPEAGAVDANADDGQCIEPEAEGGGTHILSGESLIGFSSGHDNILDS